MAAPDFAQESSPVGRCIFATTHWSVVLAASQGDTSEAIPALEKLCRTYWYPLYAFVRRQGQIPEDAADLTQAFFARLLAKGALAVAAPERGRFRCFLIGAMKNFLTNEWDRACAQKRGGTSVTISFDGIEAEQRYMLEPVDSLDPGAFFDRQWALSVLDEALRKLEAEQLAAGKERVFRRVQSFLTGDTGGGTYADAARELAMTEAAIKMTVSRLRARCRELLRGEIAQTVEGPLEVDEEFRALIEALKV